MQMQDVGGCTNSGNGNGLKNQAGRAVGVKRGGNNTGAFAGGGEILWHRGLAYDNAAYPLIQSLCNHIWLLATYEDGLCI